MDRYAGVLALVPHVLLETTVEDAQYLVVAVNAHSAVKQDPHVIMCNTGFYESETAYFWDNFYQC